MSTSTTARESNGAAKQLNIPPISVEEEDAIIHTRITNDERPLRRVIKKFHNYASLAYTPIVPAVPSASQGQITIDDARESFLVELASFQLLLKKSTMICEAEARQVEEYQKKRQRIEYEHGNLRGQIEQLKTSLEHAQMMRKRKMEYDLVAEKVNVLPSREELQQSIDALTNDMAAIRVEHETQARAIENKKAALDSFVSGLRVLGKDKDIGTLAMASPSTPALDGAIKDLPDTQGDSITGDISAGIASLNVVDGAERAEEKEEGEDDKPPALDIALSSLNPDAAPFHPSVEEGEDYEMGEVSEDPKDVKGKKKAREEELEEGEASDSSSALSDPPDD